MFFYLVSKIHPENYKGRGLLYFCIGVPFLLQNKSLKQTKLEGATFLSGAHNNSLGFRR